ncbi:MAG TPA: sugar O-acetyltransferase [Clostridiales bacterium]|nr:sugar O-acetyltransferase [Clostridiales bacterium]
MKTEKQKMLSGELYYSADLELAKERQAAKKLLFEFNNANPEDLERRVQILRQLLKVKGKVHIESPFYCDYGYNITLGDNFYANHGCIILDVNKVIIGDNVMFAPYVQIYSATHPTDPQVRVSGLELGKPITIGDNVWIGGGAIICPGVTIGDNTTIGAGSVVVKDIPANVVAAGNPCKIIKKL